jgi:hypothetical protein
MVGEHYTEKWKPYWPDLTPLAPNAPPGMPMPTRDITRAEFDALKRDVEEMKALLKRAKEYDERNGEPDCEVDEKMALLRRVAEAVGISLDDVIGKKEAT